MLLRFSFEIQTVNHIPAIYWKIKIAVGSTTKIIKLNTDVCNKVLSQSLARVFTFQSFIDCLSNDHMKCSWDIPTPCDICTQPITRGVLTRI